MESIGQLSRQMRVGLLDFEPIRIAGLREIFAEQPDFQVVATDWAMAFRESSFDLVVVVLKDQAFSLALLARLRSRHPGLKVLVIGSGSEQEKILEAINAGAKGWLEETATPAQSRDCPGPEHSRADRQILRGAAHAQGGSGESHRAVCSGGERRLGRQRALISRG